MREMVVAQRCSANAGPNILGNKNRLASKPKGIDTTNVPSTLPRPSQKVESTIHAHSDCPVGKLLKQKSIKARNARKAISMAATLRARYRPSEAPAEAAS